MFHMRLPYDYSCAILVYSCLNVTLFLYDMLKLKILGLRMIAIL